MMAQNYNTQCFGLQSNLPVHEVGRKLEGYLNIEWEYREADSMGGDYCRTSDLKAWIVNNYVSGEGQWRQPKYKRCQTLLEMSYEDEAYAPHPQETVQRVQAALGGNIVFIGDCETKSISLISSLFWMFIDEIGLLPLLAGWRLNN